MTVEIRRRTGLVATVAVLAGVFAAGYVWRFAVVGDGVLLAIGVVLSVVAGVYCAAWFGARTPLLVADATGLRVRLGSAWTGVRWDQVDRVEVAARGRVRDGHLAVRPSDESAVLAGATRRSRMEAAWNRKVYGAALAVPYGLATTVSVDDLPARLRQLADGRAAVVVPEQAEASEQPIAEGHSAQASGEGDDWSAAQREGSPVPPAAATTAAAPRRAPLTAAASPKPLIGLPVRRVAGGGGVGQPARRENVTIAMRRETSTEGTLALSAPADEVLTEELPEISELRRAPSPAGPEEGRSGGNVSLIIDATTDLSARAMRKVRRPVPDDVGPADDVPQPAAAEQESGEPLFLGGELRRARENLRLSVDELADRTRIRPYVIECMEADDFSPCGGDFYARGHLRMLARVLGVASEPLIATYDERFATAPVNLRDVFDVERTTGATGMLRGGAAGANWGGLIVAVLVLVLIWGVARFFADDSNPAPVPPTSTHNSTGSLLHSPPTADWSVSNSPVVA